MKWIISELFYPDEVSTALIMTEIAEKFADSEKVGVICGPKGYEKSYNQQEKEIQNNIEIYRVNAANLDKNNISLRIIRMLFLTIGMAFKVLSKVKKGDEVLIVTNPIFLLPIIALLKKILKFRLNILVHDVFPDNLLPAQLVKSNSLKYRALNKIFNWGYNQSDNLIVLGSDMKDIMLNKLRTKSDKIKIIPNWYDPNIYPIKDFSASDYYNINMHDKIVIAFAGNIGRLQGLQEFIDCFIKADNEDLLLILIGDGAVKAELETEIRQKNIKNILFVGSKPRSEQNEFLNACDIGLITLSSGMKGIGVPSKTYNIMAAGKPILYIGDKDSEVDCYINKYRNGWSYDWSDSESLITLLRELKFENRKEIAETGSQSLERLRNDFSKESVLNLFDELK